MPRIYKGTAATLKLLIPTCPLDSELTDVSVTLYTDPKDGSTVFTRNIEIDGNILTLEFPAYAFTKKSDGVINYIVKGKLDGEQFLVQRQSNYFLKTPDGFDAEAYPIPGDVKVTSLEATITENGSFSFKPETDEHFNPIELWEGATITVDVPAEEGGDCNLEEKRIEPSMGEMDENGYIVVEEDEGYDGLSRVIIDPSTIYNEGIEEGKNQGGGESGSCNLEDKWVTPSMSERDDNGFIVVDQSEGYDGLDRVVIDPTTIYNEGIEEGKNQSGGGGDCNIQGSKTVELDGDKMGIYPDEGYDGILEVIVEAGKRAEEWREEGRNDVRNKLQSIEITENGRYSIEDQIYVESLRYNGGYHTDTISTYDINRIEVTFKADTSESINGQGQPFILGGSLWGVDESGENNDCARAIQYAFGRIVGYWEGKWTDATSILDGEWITITLDENGMTVKYPTYERYCEYTHNNGSVNGGGDIFPFIIGGQGRRKSVEDGDESSNLIDDSQFRGLIKEVKINTNSMGEVTYIPKNWGYGVWDRKVENTGEYLSALEPTEGEVTMNGEWERKYGEGWKEINVNVVSPFTTQEISYSDYQNMANYDNNTIYLISE